MLRFGHIEILSADPQAARRFYEDLLGFELTVVQSEDFIWLRQGELEVLIRPGDPPAPAGRYESAPTGFVLYTDRLDELLEGLQARGLEVRGTVDSERCFTFTDPDGNWFQLVDPGDH